MTKLSLEVTDISLNNLILCLVFFYGYYYGFHCFPTPYGFIIIVISYSHSLLQIVFTLTSGSFLYFALRPLYLLHYYGLLKEFDHFLYFGV